jgi:hypothetical protein
MSRLFTPLDLRTDDEVLGRRKGWIDARAKKALSRMWDPYARVEWQSEGFKMDMVLAGYLRPVEKGYYLTDDGFQIWAEANEGSPFVRSGEIEKFPCDPDVQRRRDLVPYDEVRREFWPGIADQFARKPERRAS